VVQVPRVIGAVAREDIIAFTIHRHEAESSPCRKLSA
jgi:hypothetical protein